MSKHNVPQAGTIDALVHEYAAMAMEHGRATEIGDSEAANLAYDRLIELFGKIDAAGSRDRLFTLLKHPSPRVRSSAAFHTYSLDPQRSEEVLEDVAQEKSLVGFSASMTLQELRSGNLRAP